MNIIKRLYKARKLKLQITLLILCNCLNNSALSQEAIANTKIIETQANIDWKVLDSVKITLGTGYREAIDASFLEMRKYEDKIYKNRSLLAKNFWNNYPYDKRRDQALYTYFSHLTEPHFLPNEISDSVTQAMRNTSRRDTRILRLQPKDVDAMEAWRQAGDAMVASVINSDASLKRKAIAELQLITREFRYAITLERALIKEKSELELEYWNRFEIQYWLHIRLLLENHINKYATLKIGASHVKSILNLLKIFSPAASDSYWMYFYKITRSDNPRANQPGIKALHKMAFENVAAIESLKEIDYTKPLNMEFTAMDGTKISLADMRGKVVLIDFWATYCGPCIKEMPHVRAMYDKYKENGFEVVGIAADGDSAKERIYDILEKKDANWPQRLDRGADAVVSFHALYEIKTLPTVWLLSKNGIIVDKNARGERLEPLIRKYLGLEK